jgi:RNA polymerase sigma factor (TIGR02999 family)
MTMTGYLRKLSSHIWTVLTAFYAFISWIFIGLFKRGRYLRFVIMANVERQDMSDVPGPITQLIRRVQTGDEAARHQLWEELYPLLRQRAAAMLRSDDVGGVARASDILQGACLQLLAREKMGWNDSRHLIRYATTVMRNLITDLARGPLKRARAGIPITDEADFIINHDVSWIEVDEALNQLETINVEAARVVELRAYGGLSNEEIATNLGISVATVKRRFEFARAFIESRSSADKGA